MKFGKTDFAKIQASLLVVVLAIAAGTASVLLSLQQTKSVKLANGTAVAEHNEFERKLKQVRNEENEIRQKAALFSNLQARGVIGEEQRLDWVELLKDIRDKRRLLSVEFEIAPQRALDSSPANNFSFYASTMKLQFKPLHEEDVVRLLGDLRSQAKALIQVKSCNVSRLPRGSVEPGGSVAYLQADCQIDWVTAREAASK
jgi:hypothetical protein